MLTEQKNNLTWPKERKKVKKTRQHKPNFNPMFPLSNATHRYSLKWLKPSLVII